MHTFRESEVTCSGPQGGENRDNDAANRAVEELEAQKKANRDLAADLAQYKTDTRPESATSDSGSEPKPAKRTSRARKSTKSTTAAT